MKKGMVVHAAKIAVAAGTLAVALAGCCLFDKKCCGSNSCCKQDKGCCKAECCETQPCCEKKSHGMNTSMTLGLGTDGVHAGGAANVGSHGVSGGVGGAMH